MGASSDIMHEFVVKEIGNFFSRYEGWKLTTQQTGTGYDTLVQMERRNGGHRECANILVTFGASVPSPLPEDLMKPGCSPDGTPVRFSCAVMVPANADTSGLPGDVNVYTMRSFAIEGKDLIWVKKPVKKEDSAKAAA